MKSHRFWAIVFTIMLLIQCIGMWHRGWPHEEEIFFWALAILANMEWGIGDILEKLEGK